MFTIRPRASPRGGWPSISRTAARHSRNGPRRLTAIIASQSSGSVSSSGLECGPARAALLTSTSSAPQRCTARATSAWQSDSSETSAATYSASPPSAAMTASVGSPPVSGSRRTSATRTTRPSAARRRAIARPMPDAPPVTIAERGTRGSILESVARVAFVAHCLLNQNAKVDGGARCPGVYSPLVDVLRERGWELQQMPCPELAFTGLNRFWAVREQLDTLAFRRHCARIAQAVAAAIEAHVARGDDVVIAGLDGSPSMGVRVTSSAPARGGRPEWPDGAPELTAGRGIMVEELLSELERRGVPKPRAGGITHVLPDHDPAAERAQLVALLDGG